MTGYDIHKELHPEFHNNPFIQSIEDNSRWTISDPKDKKPINIRNLINGETKIYGARTKDENSLGTLREITELAVTPDNDLVNCAYYLSSLHDDYVCLDIEPKCPDDIKEKLLKLPYVYGETSMSGHGYHLILPLPDDFTTNPAYENIKNKAQIREKHGYYEVLTSHYVTFTRNMLPESTGNASFEKILQQLNKGQKPTIKATLPTNYKDIDLSTIPDGHTLYDLLLRCKSKKTIDDFDNDHSKYLFSLIGFYRKKLDCLVRTAKIQKNGHNYKTDELCTIITKTLQDTLPPREKYKTKRNGIPYLYTEVWSSYSKLQK